MLSYLKPVIFVAKQNEIPLGTMLLNCTHAVAITSYISCWDVSRQFFAHRLSTLGGARVCNFCEKNVSQGLGTIHSLKRTKLPL